MDFGISRSVTTGTATRPPAARSSARSNTWRPSRRAAQAVDQRADIYAFGLILYEMLVGRRRAGGAERDVGNDGADAGVAAAAARGGAGCSRAARAHRHDLPPPRAGAALRRRRRRWSTRWSRSTPTAAPARAGRRDAQWKAATATMLVLVLLSAGAAVWFARNRSRPPAPPPPRAPLSVLIADFRNGTGQAGLPGIAGTGAGDRPRGGAVHRRLPAPGCATDHRAPADDGVLDEAGGPAGRRA